MKVNVYAILKEHFEPSFTVTEEISSVAQLRLKLAEMQPEAKDILQASRFAVNNEFIDNDFKLSVHDNIAVLPPASGG